MLKTLINDKAKDKPLAPNEMIVPLLPTEDVIIGPFMSTSLDIAKGKLLSAVMSVSRTTRLVVMVDKLNSSEEPTLYDLRPVGTLCDIKGVMRYTRDTTRVNVDGKARVLIKEIVSRDPVLTARVETIDNQDKEYSVEERALFQILKEKYEDLSAIIGKPDERMDETVTGKNPDDGCDYILSRSPLSAEEFYEVLDNLDTASRIRRLIEHIDMALRTAQLEVDIAKTR